MRRHMRKVFLAALVITTAISPLKINAQELDKDPPSALQTQHEAEQSNKEAYARRIDELNKLLCDAKQFPVYYKMGAEQKIVMLMLRAKLHEKWQIKENSSSRECVWELSPRSLRN